MRIADVKAVYPPPIPYIQRYHTVSGNSVRYCVHHCAFAATMLLGLRTNARYGSVAISTHVHYFVLASLFALVVVYSWPPLVMVGLLCRRLASLGHCCLKSILFNFVNNE